MNSTVLIFSCILLLAIQHSAIAINCYECYPGSDGCGASSFSKLGGGVVVTTDSSAVYCSKITYASNSKSAARLYDVNGTCTPGTTTSGLTRTTYCCTTDLCNTAYSHTASVIVSMMATVTALFFTK